MLQEKMRLNKYLASCGISSRRKADQLIRSGEITLNGKRVYELGTKVDPKRDKILVSGKPAITEHRKIYLMFYKPRYVVTTLNDPEGRPSISDYLREHRVPFRVFPIGRLDWDSEGMLLLTNDGEFAQKVGHPKSEIQRTYLAKLNSEPNPAHLEKLLNGVTIPGGKVKAASVEKIVYGGKVKPWYKIVITEGKNRQVRKMFEKIGFDVLKLKRVAMGSLKIGNLDPGEFVELSLKKASLVFYSREDEKTFRRARPSLKKNMKPKRLF